MGVVEFLKEGFHSHKATGLKILLVLVTIIIFLFAASAYDTSQRLKAQQTAESQSAVANHTQTLDEIQAAVAALEASNAADHTATIKYINCVLVGLSEAGANGNALPVYQTCLANSQIPGTPEN